MKLEELARKSSDAARASVVHLDPPPIGEKAPRLSWHLPALLATAAIVLVAGVATVVLLNVGDGDGGGEGETLVAGIQDVPRLGLPQLSAWTLTAAVELPVSGDSGETRAVFDYYGSAGSDDPFAAGGLLVATLSDTALDPTDGASTETAVRGTTGFTLGPDAAGLGQATVLQWVENRELEVSIALASATMSVEQLVDIANRLTVDIEGAAVDAITITLPDELGLERVARTDGAPFDVLRNTDSSTGWLVAYRQGPDENQQQLTLTTQAGDLKTESVPVRFWSSDVRDVTVGGKDGLEVRIEVSSDAGPTTFATSVLWEPAPGVVATLTHVGTEPMDDLASLAETALELDDETWEQYRALADQVDGATSDLDTVFGQSDGTIDEQAYSWALGLRGGDLCFSIQSGDGGMDSCQPYGRPDLEPETAQTIDNGFGPQVGYVLMAAAPDVEAIRLAAGSGTIESFEADAITWFVWIGPSTQLAPENQPSFDVIVDGALVDTLEAGAEGMPVGIASDDPVGFVAANPSARSLGIVERFEPWISGSEAGAEFVLGRVDGDLCLVTDGAAPSAACHPLDDVVVFAPTETGEGIDVSHVFVTDQTPGCMDVMGIAVDTIPTSTTHWLPDRNLELIAVPGTSQGWQLFLQNPSTGNDVAVDLPEVHGAMSWPADLC